MAFPIAAAALARLAGMKGLQSAIGGSFFEGKALKGITGFLGDVGAIGSSKEMQGLEIASNMFGGMREKAVSGLGTIGAGLGQQSPFAAQAGVTRGLGEMGGGVPVIGPLIEGLGKLGAIVPESVEAIRKWTRGLHDANMQFADFSSGMAAVQANQEVQQIDLMMGKGDARASTAGDLADAMMDLERVMAPMENVWANLQNVVMSQLVTLLARVLTPLSRIAELIEKVFPEDPEEWEERKAEISRGAWGAMSGAGDALTGGMAGRLKGIMDDFQRNRPKRMK